VNTASEAESADLHPLNTLDAQFRRAMALGRNALAAGNLDCARNHLEMAHSLGHDDLARHLEVHRLRLTLARRSMHAPGILSEFYSLAALRLFGRLFEKRHQAP
jgi:hypothetical protein